MKLLPCRIVYCLLIRLLPAVGYRVNDNGRLIYQGTDAWYWSSTQYSSDVRYGYRWSFSSGDSRLNYTTKANGFSVRCVK